MAVLLKPFYKIFALWADHKYERVSKSQGAQDSRLLLQARPWTPNLQKRSHGSFHEHQKRPAARARTSPSRCGLPCTSSTPGGSSRLTGLQSLETSAQVGVSVDWRLLFWYLCMKEPINLEPYGVPLIFCNSQTSHGQNFFEGSTYLESQRLSGRGYMGCFSNEAPLGSRKKCFDRSSSEVPKPEKSLVVVSFDGHQP